jgi:hypothetical protein
MMGRGPAPCGILWGPTAGRKGTDLIDFELPEDVKDIQRRVAAFVNDVVLPADVEAG